MTISDYKYFIALYPDRIDVAMQTMQNSIYTIKCWFLVYIMNFLANHIINLN